MLVSSYVNGFGGPSLGSSLLQLVETSRARASYGRSGLGAFTTDWDAFMASRYTSPTSPTYQDSDRLVWCNKNTSNHPVCQLNAYAGAAAANGPVAQMQRAVDALINKIPVWHMKVGQQANITGPDGVTTVRTIDPLGQSPIAMESGYDGLVGNSTGKYALAALILAGALKPIPNTVAGAYITPTNANIAMYAHGIAEYLTDVNENFDSLLADYQARGRVPATDPFTPSSVPALAPYVPSPRKNTGVILGAAALMVGLTTVASISAAKKKPGSLYSDMPSPAFGRRRGRRSRRSYARGY